MSIMLIKLNLNAFCLGLPIAWLLHFIFLHFLILFMFNIRILRKNHCKYYVFLKEFPALLSFQISWFRKKDKTLLTVGLSTYSSDDRFFVEHTRHLGNWALRIKNAREDDEGLYECQISSHPPQSIFIELRIVGEYIFISTSLENYIQKHAK